MALLMLLALPRAAGGADPTDDIPALRPPTPVVGEGLPIVRIEVVSTDPEWPLSPVDLGVKVGEEFSAGVSRKAAREVAASAGASEVRVESSREGAGVLLRLVATPSRLVGDLRIDSPLEVADVLRGAGVERGRSVTRPMLRQAEQALRDRALLRGYPAARVSLLTRSTDDPRVVLLFVEVAPGEPRRLRAIRTEVEALSMPPGLREHLGTHGVAPGDRADEEELSDRDRALQERLRARGFYQARVQHRVYDLEGETYLLLSVRPGPLFRLRFEGNRQLDGDQLEELLDFERDIDRSVAHAISKIRDEYQRIGFLDAEVTGEERGGPSEPVHELVFTVREGSRVRVAKRLYPCLDGGRTPEDLGSEIDSFLEEELPGVTLVGPVDPGAIDATLGPTGQTGARPEPLDLAPRGVFLPEIYDRALKHIRDLYRSEGHLAAVVGPLQVVRRRCDPASPPGRCVPLPVPLSATALEPRCALDVHGVPVEEPPMPAEALCRPNPLKGIKCEPAVWLRIPVKPGPVATVYDVAFDGALAFPEPDLLQISGLELGRPASSVKIEDARRALADFYKEKGYAYSQVTTSIELSPDKQRARVRFTLLERQRVIVQNVRIIGNSRTRESVIRGRLRLAPGDVFSQSEVRRSEELLATLGVFSSVTVALDEPAIPATRKDVLVTVVERDAQYLEVRPGVSTGEGVRGVLEYGHRNLGGLGVQLTLRVQLSYLPDFLINDARVQDNFNTLPLGRRLERRNSAGLQFPTVFRPDIRFGLDIIDVRSNSRDFGLTKDAILPTFTYAPRRQLTMTLGGSVELNNVGIFSGETILRYLSQPGITNDLSRLLRVPDGETRALSERIGAVWDRRDTPLGATQGTLLGGSIEHVHAYPAEDNPNTITSDFVRFAGRAGVYVPLSKKGLTFAALIGGGYNRQLIDNSKTYPDRLFFLGGVDSLRGFARESLVPQDIADQLEADAQKPATDPSRLTIDKVAIRGGDVFINPRIELRIPLAGPIQTVIFADSGNVWVDPTRINPFNLRYTGGTGVRLITPIGPVAVDYGLNLSRRFWEDIGAFHFSIGLF
jgi:outer membrane protein assembly complex protein YaeT